jgi:hypothetical protein
VPAPQPVPQTKPQQQTIGLKKPTKASPEKTDIDFEMTNIERFRIRKLKEELSENLRSVINQLNCEQKDLFAEEDDRLKILAHLEQVHQEL